MKSSERGGRGPLARLGGMGRVWLLNAALASIAVALFTLPVPHLPSLHSPLSLSGLELAVMAYLAEVFVIHLQIRRDAFSFSLSEVPLVLGLFFCNPLALIVGQIVGRGTALVLNRHQSALKATFNLAQVAVQTGLALIVFHAVVHGHHPIGAVGWAATFVAAGLASTVSVFTIACAMSLAEGRLQFGGLLGMLGMAEAVTATNSSLALVGVTILWLHPISIWLLGIPAAMLVFAYRSYISEREKNKNLEFLHESTRILHRGEELDAAIAAMLSKAREMFRAEIAEITLFPAESGERALRTTVSADSDPTVMRPVEVDIDTRLPDRAIFLQNFGDRGVDDAMVTPLRGEARAIGTMLIGNRLGDVGRFDSEDLRLFETLADHVSVALENGRLERSLAQLTELESQLSYQAFHDSLTGLANRSLFVEAVETALAQMQRGEGDRPAVLFIDVDDFKTVNDSQGHAAGDILLVAIAERIQSCLRPDDLAARLGGDEFAVLLRSHVDKTDACRIVERIASAVRAPMMIHNREVMARTSTGVAMADDGSTVEDLLRNADVAMYMAKTRGKDTYEVFVPSMHKTLIERHQLKADLERAIARSEFVLHYQPIVDINTGRIVAAEALLRWEHPERGLVPPLQFVPLAEENGLIVPIGREILRQACAQARQWQLTLPGAANMAITVNLSPRQFEHAELLADVMESLTASGLPPETLVLEITESLTVTDNHANVEKMEQLKRLGVRIAIDDFGTGYSSLSYLRRLPIDILKLAKEFVDDLGKDGTETALARAIVQLGQTLDLDIIAEGIEDDSQLRILQEFGCGLGQGWYFAKAVPPHELEALARVAGPRRLNALPALDETATVGGNGAVATTSTDSSTIVGFGR